ncbi:fructose-1,6-bisphosphatase class 1/Sedoheputulose-1,7-bisphosphatase, partial [Pavlovales sp. CCMP2436]
ARNGLARTLLGIQEACKQTATLMRRGLREQGCVEGLAAELFVSALGATGVVCTLALEPYAEIVSLSLKPHGAGERYAVVLNPLDGARDADAGIFRSVFGIYSVDEQAAAQPPAAHVLRRGSGMVAAGYALYGASTLFVLAAEEGGVHGFTLEAAPEPALSEFVLSHAQIRTPRGRGCSVNLGHACKWPAAIAAFVNSLAAASPARTLRHVGLTAGEAHRTLLHGGLFLHPPMRGTPFSKLLFEAAPLAFVAEKVGGASSDGSRPLLELLPSCLQQRTAVYIGSRGEVGALE